MYHTICLYVIVYPAFNGSVCEDIRFSKCDYFNYCENQMAKYCYTYSQPTNVMSLTDC